MRTTFSAGGVVISTRGDVLIVNQNGDSWSLPKGHIDPGEDAKAAAIREIQEESGISELMFKKKLGTYRRYRIGLDETDDTTELKNITMLLFTTHQLELKPEDPNNPEARWVKPEKVPDWLTHPKDKAFFTNSLDKLKDIIA